MMDKSERILTESQLPKMEFLQQNHSHPSTSVTCTKTVAKHYCLLAVVIEDVLVHWMPLVSLVLKATIPATNGQTNARVSDICTYMTLTHIMYAHVHVLAAFCKEERPRFVMTTKRASSKYLSICY